jgi:hypothetical protein
MYIFNFAKSQSEIHRILLYTKKTKKLDLENVNSAPSNIVNFCLLV